LSAPGSFLAPKMNNRYTDFINKYPRKGDIDMKVNEGDVLVCGTEDCQVELTVTKACKSETCSDDCDIEATCCKEPMEVKK
jgi:hypothetical protein